MHPETDFAQRVKRLAEATKAVHAQILSTRQAASARNWELAKMLDAMSRLSEQKQLLHLGGTLPKWVAANLKDEKGKPRSWAWALNLMGTYREVKDWPTIAERVRTGEYAWSKANAVIRLCKAAGWRESASQRLKAKGVDDINEYHRQVREEVVGKFEEAARLTEAEIRDKIIIARGDEPKTWTRIGGSVTFEEAAGWKEAVRIACVLTEEEVKPVFSQELAVVVQALEMIRDAARERAAEETQDDDE